MQERVFVFSKQISQMSARIRSGIKKSFASYTPIDALSTCCAGSSMIASACMQRAALSDLSAAPLEHRALCIRSGRLLVWSKHTLRQKTRSCFTWLLRTADGQSVPWLQILLLSRSPMPPAFRCLNQILSLLFLGQLQETDIA